METDFAKFLTFKQKVFCDEYLRDRNATAAALRAGYSNKTALSGYLMTLPKIQLHLRQEMKELSQKVQVNHEMILSELCKIAFGNMGNYFCADGSIKPMTDLNDDAKAALWNVAVSEGDGKQAPVTKFRMYNKLAALDKIAKHLNFYSAEEQEPEKVYIYVDEDTMHEDDSFDAYNLMMQKSEEKLKKAERKEEDQERARAEEALKQRNEREAVEQEGGSMKHEAFFEEKDIEGGSVKLKGFFEIPKNTEDLGQKDPNYTIQDH